ncbi:MAG: hypothetical protein ACKOBN_08830 [Flavobacteriales bacterium]
MEAIVKFLFVSFLILLAVIAYKRLLKRFQKGQIVHKDYCELYNLDQDPASGELAFYFVCPEAQNVQFGIWQNRQLLHELANQHFEKGGHILRFDSTALENGVYYYGIITSDQETTKRMQVQN